MRSSQISMSRRHVLGELYGRCTGVSGDIPVYLAGVEPELLGYVNESLGEYSDAFSFFLDEHVCKKLAGGHYEYSFDHEPIDEFHPAGPIKLNSIILVGRTGYAKPIPRRGPRV